MSPIGAIGGVVPYFDMGLAVCGAVPSMLAVATDVVLYCWPFELEDRAKGGEFLFELPLKQLEWKIFFKIDIEIRVKRVCICVLYIIYHTE